MHTLHSTKLKSPAEKEARLEVLTQGAVAAVPALAADAGPVLALAVLRAARVAGQLVAALARPARPALAAALVAHAVGAAVQAAQCCNKAVNITIFVIITIAVTIKLHHHVQERVVRPRLHHKSRCRQSRSNPRPARTAPTHA